MVIDILQVRFLPLKTVRKACECNKGISRIGRKVV